MNTAWDLQVLDNDLTPTAHSQFPEEQFFFQDDGAPCHRSKLVREWMGDNNVTPLAFWPGSSPDLNPIENLWAVIGGEIRRVQPNSRKELEAALEDAWRSDKVASAIPNLIRSMPRRIAEVLKNKGHHSKY